MEEEKKCDNCKYYTAHYVKSYGRFSKANCAHCSNGKMQFKYSAEHIKNNVACKRWEPYELQRQENRDTIEKVIRDMQKRLEQIALVFESE